MKSYIRGRFSEGKCARGNDIKLGVNNYMGYIFTNVQRIEEIKKSIAADKRLKRELEDLAEEYMMTEPMSVTFHKSPAVSGNIHDYFSEGPYWWPDEKNPGGPYIRRDGEVNPDTFNYHKDDLSKLCRAVCVLAQAGLYLERESYYQKAMELIQVWFLDEKTKMAPHLEYAQAIRGKCDGRGIGIIDTAECVMLIYGANIIEMAGLYPKEMAGLKAWFADYVTWLNTSEKGLAEKHYFNNHANWWNTQVAAYCAFIGNEALLKECFEKYRNDILVNQVDEKGVFIDEVTRTRSYSYTIYNMTACAIICEVAYYRGIDLWNYVAENGHSLRKCVEFFTPYYENLFLWSYEQISIEGCNCEKLPMKLAAMRYQDAALEKINQNKRKGVIPCSQISHMGVLDLV